MTVRVSTACTACGACLITCPTSALSPAPGRPAVRDQACTDCLACIEVCPAGAISTADPVARGAAGTGGAGRAAGRRPTE